MNVRYLYRPEKYNIYFCKDQALTLGDSSYGHTMVMTISGKYIDVLSDYSDELEEIERSPIIGKIIRPRWDMEELKWEWRRRGVTHDEIIHARHEKRF